MNRAQLRRVAAAIVAAATLVAIPTLARWDTYRCVHTRTTHFGRCCTSNDVLAQVLEWHPATSSCCEIEDKGAEPPASPAGSVGSGVGAPSAPIVAELLVPAGPSAAQGRREPRSRGPPASPLWLRHSSFLL